MTLVFNSAVAALYFFSTLGHCLYLIFSNRRMGRLAVGLFLTGALLHTGLLAAQVLQNPYPFFLGDGDFFYVAAWASAVAYFLALRKYRLIGLSTVFSLAVLILFILAEIRKKHFYLGVG